MMITTNPRMMGEMMHEMRAMALLISPTVYKTWVKRMEKSSLANKLLLCTNKPLLPPL